MLLGSDRRQNEESPAGGRFNESSRKTPIHLLLYVRRIRTQTAACFLLLKIEFYEAS